VSGSLDAHAHRIEAEVRRLAAQQVARHPSIHPVIVAQAERLVTELRGSGDVAAWQRDTEGALREQIAVVPELHGRGAWLLVELLKVCGAIAAGRATPMRGADAGMPSGLTDLALAAEAREGIVHRAHLIRDVDVVPPKLDTLRAEDFAIDTPTEWALAAVDAWAKRATREVERHRRAMRAQVAAASEIPLPTTRKRNDADLAFWVDWWYRARVRHESIAAIARHDYGDDRAGTAQHYVSEQIKAVAALLR
jgi:hypothetical protein